MFYDQMKHSAVRRELKMRRAADFFFFTNFEVPHLVMKHFSHKIALAGEIKNAKMSSFSPDFRTIIKR